MNQEKHFISKGLLANAPLQSAVRVGFFALVTVYFIFHIFNGERGLYAYIKQSRNLEVKQQELSALTSQRTALENRVHLMSDGSLDLDLLDEQSRRILGSAKPTEAVIMNNEAARKPSN